MPTKTFRKANPGAVEMVLQLASSAWLFAIFVIVYTYCILLLAMKDAGWARRPQKITVLLPIIYDFSYSYTAWKASPTKALQCEEALNTLIIREHVIRTKKPDPNKLASIDTMQKRSRTYRCRNPYNET